MKLALQHTDTNKYPRCGIFIQHASPEVWLQEITRMQLKLSECTIYPCPDLEVNSISGVLIIFKTAQQKVDILNHPCVLKVQTGFYIPENTQLNMSLTQEEYAKLLQGKPHFFHHEYGLIELKEEVQWDTLLQLPKEYFPNIETPAKGIHIPTKVTAFSVEIEEKETEKLLSNPLGDEKVDTNELPFEMKKVLEGNNKEIEKYLKYLEKNPEAALKMAVPLDMLGTSRGKAFAQYKFKSSFFDTIRLGNASESTKTTIKTIVGILAIIAIFWIGSFVVDTYKKNQIEVVSGKLTVSPNSTEEEAPTDEALVLETNDKDEAAARRKRELENYPNSDNKYVAAEEAVTDFTLKGFLLFLIFFVGFIFVGYLIVTRNKKRPKASANKNTSSSWMNLPEESELFSFEDDTLKKKKGYDFYFGGNELSVYGKIMLIFLLIAAMAYLLYPMFTDTEVKTIFIIITIGILIRLLIFLLNKNKSLRDDK
ncbi:hypothetical protein KORDIASMS9_04052 [Kordia sp. SMS9]|uniref:hypothetical protein n=1 Tax=Kordia sp. SMS9 TaxID=2282170 RepID=UPI000E0D143D|nr:hypothetical protein [Kordia sp. SMS9]AXG71794.1 hypothetical protein KORDIASMS9_04052 [Kordia sp. SMS9]